MSCGFALRMSRGTCPLKREMQLQLQRRDAPDFGLDLLGRPSLFSLFFSLFIYCAAHLEYLGICSIGVSSRI